MGEKIREFPATVVGWFKNNQIHAFDTGLREGRSRWRSTWWWLLWLTVILRVGTFILAGALLLFNGSLEHWTKKTFGIGAMWQYPAVFALGFALIMLLHLTIAVIPPHISAKSWYRDREKEWRDHISVLPITSGEVLAAKSHIWLSIIVIGELISVMGALLLGAGVAFFIVTTGQWPWPVSDLMTQPEIVEVFEQISLNTMIIWGFFFTIVGTVSNLLWWLLGFGFVAYLGMKEFRPLANVTVAGLMLMAAGASVGMATGVTSFLIERLLPTEWQFIFSQAFNQGVMLVGLVVGNVLVWKWVHRETAKRYSLSG